MVTRSRVDVASFKRDIEKFIEDTDDAVVKVLQATSLELGRRIILKTPVDTGRARGNWQAGINTVPGDQLTTKDKSGASSISKVAAESSRAKVNDAIFVINNIPYIENLESGSSTQAPQGMVRTTVTEFSGIVDEEARKNR